MIYSFIIVITSGRRGNRLRKIFYIISDNKESLGNAYMNLVNIRRGFWDVLLKSFVIRTQDNFARTFMLWLNFSHPRPSNTYTKIKQLFRDFET